jgi:phenylacetate-CoA ligase
LSAASLDEYLAELRAFAPEVLWVYPTGGDRLASLCIDRGQRLPVKLVMSSSEMLSDAAMQRMQQVFCAPVVDYYGQAERVCMAVRREVGTCWFEPAYGHVELRPAVLEGAAVGTAHARVVATGFWNDAMPLVRYDTGDLIEYDTAYGPRELERVALGLLPFTRVVGREPGFLLAPDGAQIQGLAAIVGNASRVRSAQFVQAADYSVEIRVVPEPGFGPRDEAALIERARQRIPSSMAIQVQTVDSLQARCRSCGATGR